MCYSYETSARNRSHASITQGSVCIRSEQCCRSGVKAEGQGQGQLRYEHAALSPDFDRCSGYKVSAVVSFYYSDALKALLTHRNERTNVVCATIKYDVRFF